MIGIEERVLISPPTWPATAAIAPGDLTKYAPIGLGMSAPIVLMPWDDLSSALVHGSFYGSLAHSGDPIRDAPVNASTGGVVYFDDRFEPRELATLLRFLGVSLESERYAVFAAESSDPKRDRYLAQIRIVEPGAMRLFGVSPDPQDDAFEQNLAIGALVAAFINAQRKRYSSNLTGAIAGSLGGDGDWASETLGFGFMAENAKNGVYRLWSRPWLVTK